LGSGLVYVPAGVYKVQGTILLNRDKVKGLKRMDGKPHDTRTCDAYATGFVLVVARELGAPANDRRLRRGIDWLLKNQRISGKWYTRSPGRDRRHYISNTGSAFAVLGLQACGKLPGWPLSATP
jgi:squalene-hopene/tetraprenyl-beta-curcumene cyclase